MQRRIQESIDAGAPDEEIAGLRLELEQRLAPVEERVGTIRDQVAQFRQNFDPAALREQIGNLRGRLEGINPQTMQDLDFGEIARRVQEQLPQDRGVVPPDLLERIRAVEQREGPDLGNIREQIGELRGQLSQRPEDRGVVPPEVLERIRAVEQREGPDEAAIAERVRSGLDPRIADLQQRISEGDSSAQAMADRIAALREQQGQATEGRRGLSDRLAALREQQGQAAQGRRALEERLGGRLEEIRGSVSPLSERIAQLRGRLDERPQIDENALIERIRGGIQIPQVDLSGLEERLASIENQRARDTKGALNPARGSGTDEKDVEEADNGKRHTR